MKSAVVRLFGRAFSANPVTVRELRQLVRSKFIVRAMAAYPVAMTAIFLCSVAMSSGKAALWNRGQAMFDWLFMALCTLTVLFVPLFAGIKLVLDTRKGCGEDLQFATALSPLDVVSGKMAAATVVSLMFFALSVPFAAFAYVMRGVDVGVAAWMAFFTFVASSFSLSMAMVIGSLRLSFALRMVAMLVAFGGVALVLISMGEAVISFGFFGSMAVDVPADSAVSVVVATFLMAAIAMEFARTFAASTLSPPHLDCNFPLRRAEAVILVVFLAALCAGPLLADPSRLPSSMDGSPLAAAIAFAVVVSWRASFIRPGVSRAVAAAAPRSFALRLLKFPFSTGQVPGILFSMGMAALTFAAARMFLALDSSGWTSDESEFLVNLAAFYGEMVLFPYLLAQLLNIFGLDKLRQRGLLLTLAWFFVMNGVTAVLEAMDIVSVSNYPVYGHIYGIFKGPSSVGELTAHVVMGLASILILAVSMAFAAPSVFRNFRPVAPAKALGGREGQDRK